LRIVYQQAGSRNCNGGILGVTKEKQFDVAVVGGAGHVGLPLALSFADKGQNVLINDLNQAAMDKIASGTVPFFEEGAEEMLERTLAAGTISFSADVSKIASASTVIVTIGTPVDEFLNPSHGVIVDCFRNLLPYLSDDHLIVLRSTIFPGTTAWLQRYLADNGCNPLIAFCPERVVQGKGIVELAQLPQIVSGMSPEAVAKARALFSIVSPEEVLLEPMEAEFAKLFDNCYRYIHFSISNQLYMIANSAGVDFDRIIDGMSYKYPRSQGIPRPGFAAGPCLFKDTMQLSAFAKNQFSLGLAAMQINEGLVLYLVEQLRERFALEGMTVGLLGMAFKPNSDDVRASLSYKMKKTLLLHAKSVLTTDPNVTTDDELVDLQTVLDQSDILILCVPHDEYKGLDTGATPVVDVWRSLENANRVL